MTFKLEPFYPFKVLFFEVTILHFHFASQCLLFYKADFRKSSGLFLWKHLLANSIFFGIQLVYRSTLWSGEICNNQSEQVLILSKRGFLDCKLDRRCLEKEVC